MRFVHETSKRPSKKRKQDGSDSANAVGWSTISAYVAAVTDLCQEQHMKGNNVFPHPRGRRVRALLDSVKGQENQRQRAQYVDRGTGNDL